MVEVDEESKKHTTRQQAQENQNNNSRTTTTARTRSRDTDDKKRSNNNEDEPLNKKQRTTTTIIIDDNSDDEPMETDSDDDSSTEDNKKENDKSASLSQQSQQQQSVIKSRLSKWAARLFDPNRPKGLIQPPQIIPLNDDFLKAFGKREKKFDSSIGRTIDIDTQIPDDENDNSEEDDDSNNPNKQRNGSSSASGSASGNGKNVNNNNSSSSKAASAKAQAEGRKIKITNLKYSTTAETLQQACQRFGPVVEVNLIMDQDRTDPSTGAPLNMGRAYVTFQSAESAQACVDKHLGGDVDGRVPRCSLAEKNNTKGRKSAGGGVANTGALSRYWQQDISTKCFRCGQVGHREAECMNAAVPRPCPLCANTNHDMRNCPVSRVCFNCGVPGHVSRECKQPRGQPARRVCSICFQSGHHRIACRNLGSYAPAVDALCLLCGRRGHFLCKDMTFFFGLDGVSCFNCGMRGHLGYDCQRPNLEELSRDERLAGQELARAESFLFDDLEQEMVRSSNKNVGPRGRPMQRSHDQHHSRAKSLEPRHHDNRGRRGGGDRDRDRGDRNRSQQRGYGSGNQNRRRSGGGGGRRGY